MAITNGYATLAQLRARLEFAASDTDDDSILEDIIEAASRAIDAWLDTRFYATSETRTYTPTESDFIMVDDLLSVTTLKTDDDADGTYETTWSTTDYALKPDNASTDGRPYRWIEVNPHQGLYIFPVGIQNGVQIAGSFGYTSTTPLPVQEACLLMSQRLYRRKDAIFGVVGGGGLGTNAFISGMQQDSDVMVLLNTMESKKYVPNYIL